jgi:hypothetical protein
VTRGLAVVLVGLALGGCGGDNEEPPAPPQPARERGSAQHFALERIADGLVRPTYVYGDFCTGALWSLAPRPGRGATDVRRERARRPQLTHIGTDADGELVLASADGDLTRAVAPTR